MSCHWNDHSHALALLRARALQPVLPQPQHPAPPAPPHPPPRARPPRCGAGRASCLSPGSPSGLATPSPPAPGPCTVRACTCMHAGVSTRVPCPTDRVPQRGWGCRDPAPDAPVRVLRSRSGRPHVGLPSTNPRGGGSCRPRIPPGSLSSLRSCGWPGDRMVPPHGAELRRGRADPERPRPRSWRQRGVSPRQVSRSPVLGLVSLVLAYTQALRSQARSGPVGSRSPWPRPGTSAARGLRGAAGPMAPSAGRGEHGAP